MASQSMSRKRPAPGASPVNYPQRIPQGINGYTGGLGPQLSDDQFLQWGQAAQPPDSYPDSSSYGPLSTAYPSATTQASNQLARNPMNQLATRSRIGDNTTAVPWNEQLKEYAQNSEDTGEDDIGELEQQAQEAKKEAQSKRKQIPPFVQKLNSFLEDGKNTDLIRWSDLGNSFIVLDEDEFAKTLIPELFKHNNYASFVRQLNMYGFHKKVGLSDNSMRASERKNKSPSEYSNPYFRRGHPDLLWLIQKPKNIGGGGTAAKGKGRNRAESEPNEEDEEVVEEVPISTDMRPRQRPLLTLGQGDQSLSQEQFQSIQQQLAAIRNQQLQISRAMTALKREHEQLYGQAANFQDQHTRHENSINAILTFLATVYNRTLQGSDGVQGIANLFAGSIPHESSQGNVVDVGDFNFGTEGTLPKPFKRAPLLLQAPPAEVQSGRASTVSPGASNSPYQGRQTRRMSQSLRNGSTPNSGNIEEFYDTNANTPMSTGTAAGKPQQDIMSVIQNSNARHSNPASPATDFSNVLNSLENSGGHSPLTSSQRADMLRLINNSANQTGDNALINATPPSMPTNYDRKLASTTSGLESLAKLQAEQDKSVQHLTSLLQPLSPTGSIPGIGDGLDVPPPPLDIDSFLSHNDYFTDFPSDGNGNYDFSNNNNNSTTNGLNFTDYGNGDDEELFGNLPPSNGQTQNGYDGYDRSLGLDGANDGSGGGAGGRVESVASSEVTTPTTENEISTGPTTRSAKGRRYSGGLDTGATGPVKRRKRNS